MENALLGLQYLKEIKSAINDPLLNEEYPEDVTQKIVYNLYDFWKVDIDKIYDELFLNYEYGVLGDYKRLLSFVLNR